MQLSESVRKDVENIMAAVMHCSEEMGNDGMCNCARYIGERLMIRERVGRMKARATTTTPYPRDAEIERQKLDLSSETVSNLRRQLNMAGQTILNKDQELGRLRGLVAEMQAVLKPCIYCGGGVHQVKWSTGATTIACEKCRATSVVSLSTPTTAAGEVNRPRIACICGSSRFIDQMAVLGWEIEKTGKIALGLHLLPTGFPPDHIAEHDGVKEQMDELHLRKIELADEVFVVNVGGYIGESTTREVQYALKLGKPVKWLEPDKIPTAVAALQQEQGR